MDEKLHTLTCHYREFDEIWGFIDGDYIAELADAIRNLYHTEPVYVESVPVKEVFQGQTIWEGEVEVFDLPESPEAVRIYAGHMRQTMQTNRGAQ